VKECHFWEVSYKHVFVTAIWERFEEDITSVVCEALGAEGRSLKRDAPERLYRVYVEL
jgi:hypothetical protein